VDNPIPNATAAEYLRAADALSRTIDRLMDRRDYLLDQAAALFVGEQFPDEVTVTEFRGGSMQLAAGSVILSVISDDRSRTAEEPYFDIRGGHA
jgi:hypothetical protein